MNVEHALKIQGWMSHRELEWLSERASGLGLVVEFGSWCGRSAVAMSTATRVVCVDHWQGSAEHRGAIANGLNPWHEFVRHTSNYPNIRAINADLATCDPLELVGERADMVFVDASHDYASVRRDILSAIWLLKPGGLLCGHDYCELWGDVRRAVDELVSDRQLCDTIWWKP